MRRSSIWAAVAGVLLLGAGAAAAQDRAVNTGLGAVAGAVVGGPVGAVAGGAIGYGAGNTISRGLGLSGRRHYRRSGYRSRAVYRRSAHHRGRAR